MVKKKKQKTKFQHPPPPPPPLPGYQIFKIFPTPLLFEPPWLLVFDIFSSPPTIPHPPSIRDLRVAENHNSK